MTVKFISYDSKDFDIVKKIRNDVFEKEQGAIAEQEFDSFDSDPKTLFALVEENGTPVATGRIAFMQKGVKIGRIAVVRTARGGGYGAFLVKSLCRKCKEQNIHTVYVDSQLHAVGFYEKLGFRPTGENTVIDRGIEHLPMIYEG